MHSDRAVQPLTRRDWDELSPAFRDLCYQQGGAYSEAAARDVGAKAEFVGLYKGAELVGLAAVRVKRLPLLPLGVAYVNHGPLTMKAGAVSPALFDTCVDLLKAEYVGRRRLLLRLVPPQGGGEQDPGMAQCLARHGLQPLEGQHRLESFVLDLADELDGIRGRIHPKWNASLRKGERTGIEITRSCDPADFARFAKLYDELVDRKGFSARQDAAFFAKVIDDVGAGDQLVLHLAWHQGEVVAGHLCSFAGDTAVLILAAASPKGRDVMASFLLQWAAIQYAKANGNRHYDLGGVDQHANPSVYMFKQRLGGRHVVSTGAFEIAPSPARRLALEVAEQAWTRLRSRPGAIGSSVPRPAASTP